MSILVNNTSNQRLLHLLDEFAQYGKLAAGGTTRLAYTDVEKQASDRFIELCRQEGMDVRVDQVGNIIARRPGKQANAPAVACGSHLDTVINGGNFDGVLGVLSALEVVHRLNENRITTQYPIEIISFACEESSRFGVSTIGSKAMAGSLNSESISAVKDAQGVSYAEALSRQGFNPDRIPNARRKPDDLKVFLELHIEQGPVLEQTNCQIGIVQAIAAPTRFRVEVEGKAGHSGTTTMPLRQDALVAASELVLSVEKIALQEQKYNTVGTVGVLTVSPGAANVIPGKVDMIVEFRSTNAESKARALEKWFEIIEVMQLKRKVKIDWKLLSDENPVILDEQTSIVIKEICSGKGYAFQEMVSGAGHDAMNMVHLCPVGLIFVPSVDGISHHPSEFTRPEDIAAGVDLLYNIILRLAEGTEDHEETSN